MLKGACFSGLAELVWLYASRSVRGLVVTLATIYPSKGLLCTEGRDAITRLHTKIFKINSFTFLI